MEAASRFELENNGFAGRFGHFTSIYPNIPNHTRTLNIMTFNHHHLTLTYSEIPVFLCWGGEIGGELSEALFLYS